MADIAVQHGGGIDAVITPGSPEIRVGRHIRYGDMEIIDVDAPTDVVPDLYEYIRIVKAAQRTRSPRVVTPSPPLRQIPSIWPRSTVWITVPILRFSDTMNPPGTNAFAAGKYPKDKQNITTIARHTVIAPTS